ncbi:unnamed protein product [Polarella glacialis]|uniref:Uncharacterized protein n=1 Tax=Polarella glacialis TaxID=89957 RepID=A0A813F4V2_POLGL|nr:unnamed protein product [Polarella glacialis]
MNIGALRKRLLQHIGWTNRRLAGDGQFHSFEEYASWHLQWYSEHKEKVRLMWKHAPRLPWPPLSLVLPDCHLLCDKEDTAPLSKVLDDTSLFVGDRVVYLGSDRRLCGKELTKGTKGSVCEADGIRLRVHFKGMGSSTCSADELKPDLSAI